MEEKRKYRRLDLSVTLKLEYINDASEKAVREVEVEVFDLSRAGIGFHSKEKLDPDGFYDTNMVIWTKEIVPCVIHIVREVPDETGYRYGGLFVGMNDIEQRKINIYELFDEMQQ